MAPCLFLSKFTKYPPAGGIPTLAITHQAGTHCHASQQLPERRAPSGAVMNSRANAQRKPVSRHRRLANGRLGTVCRHTADQQPPSPLQPEKWETQSLPLPSSTLHLADEGTNLLGILHSLAHLDTATDIHRIGGDLGDCAAHVPNGQPASQDHRLGQDARYQ